MKKKILFVIPTMELAGAERSLVSLLTEIDKSKYEIDLLLFAKRGFLLSSLPTNINVFEIDEISQAMILEVRYLKNLIKTHKYNLFIKRIICSILSNINDLLKTKKFNTWLFIKNNIKTMNKEYDIAVSYLEGVTNYFVIDKVNAKKKIGWIHRTYDSKPYDNKYDFFVFSKFDFVCTISFECLNILKDIYVDIKDKFLLVPNLVSNKQILQLSNITSDADNWDKNIIHIVTVGRLTFQKGIDIAINAAKILKSKNINFIWHFYGQGVERKKYQLLIEKNNLCNICFLEGVKQNPYPYINNADLIVQPSRSEGKSIVLDEAKILGKPILVTNYKSVKDQIENKKNGIICDINSEDLANAIINFLNDDKLKNDIIYNLRKNVDNNTEDLLSIFDNYLFKD